MKSLPTRQLPDRPDLIQLRRQAKELFDGFLSGAPDAFAEVNRFYRDAYKTGFALHHAQLVLARSYGFDSWPKLKAFVDGITVNHLVDAVRAGDIDQVRTMLRVRPELVNREAPSSHGHMPLHYAVLARMPEMVRTLMQSGADPHTTTAGIYALRDAATPLVPSPGSGTSKRSSRSSLKRNNVARPAAHWKRMRSRNYSGPWKIATTTRWWNFSLVIPNWSISSYRIDPGRFFIWRRHCSCHAQRRTC